MLVVYIVRHFPVCQFPVRHFPVLHYPLLRSRSPIGSPSFSTPAFMIVRHFPVMQIQVTRPRVGSQFLSIMAGRIGLEIASVFKRKQFLVFCSLSIRLVHVMFTRPYIFEYKF